MRIVYKAFRLAMGPEGSPVKVSLTKGINRYAVEFTAGETHVPVLQGSKFFAFGTKATAIDFVRKNYSDVNRIHQIWACSTDGPIIPYEGCRIGGLWGVNSCVLFWDAWNRHDGTVQEHYSDSLARSAKGTVLVDNLTLLARIY